MPSVSGTRPGWLRSGAALALSLTAWTINIPAIGLGALSDGFYAVVKWLSAGAKGLRNRLPMNAGAVWAVAFCAVFWGAVIGLIWRAA